MHWPERRQLVDLIPDWIISGRRVVGFLSLAVGSDRIGNGATLPAQQEPDAVDVHGHHRQRRGSGRGQVPGGRDY